MTYIELFEKLIAFPTVSSESNLELIEFVRAFLAKHGVESCVMLDFTGRKANLFASIGPKDKPGIVLSGHTDVVPVEGQAWTADPFTLRQADGKLYGRGTCDMKGFIACVLALVPELAKAELERPVHIALTYDEETGMDGAEALVPVLKEITPPLLVWIGEATNMIPADSHKGAAGFVARVKGVAAHSSRPELGANAITAAAEIIRFIDELGQNLSANPVPGSRFNPPHSTVTVVQINGGQAINTVPDSCVLKWDCRVHPGESADAIEKAVRDFINTRVLPDFAARGGSIELGRIDSALPSVMPSLSEQARELVRSATGREEIVTCPYATEAAIFQNETGWPMLICGPGDIAEAHKPNEFITVAQMDECVRVLRKALLG